MQLKARKVGRIKVFPRLQSIQMRGGAATNNPTAISFLRRDHTGPASWLPRLPGWVMTSKGGWARPAASNTSPQRLRRSTTLASQNCCASAMVSNKTHVVSLGERNGWPSGDNGEEVKRAFRKTAHWV